MNTYTRHSWSQINHPTLEVVEEYLSIATSYDDVPLVQSVLSYAKNNACTIDITHAVHWSCTYAQMQMLDVLDQHQSLTPHHVMTGLYSAVSGCQSEVLRYLFKKAAPWGNDFYQHVNGNELMRFVCTPGDVPESKVLECIKLLEPLLDTPELTKEVISLVRFECSKAALYLMKYCQQDVLEQTIKNLEQSEPSYAQPIKDFLLQHKLTLAVGETSAPRSHKKI